MTTRYNIGPSKFFPCKQILLEHTYEYAFLSNNIMCTTEHNYNQYSALD